jgi:Lipoprotein LpqB beta-propeller domain/Sporulation and spore germination
MITSRTGRLASAGRSWWLRAGARGRATAAAFAVTVAAGGCSTVPTSGAVQEAGAGQVGISQNYSQPIPVGPGAGWTPPEIVSGFLAASASFANDHQVAREYLDAVAQRKWKPGWAVTVVSGIPTTSTAARSFRQPLSGQQQQEEEDEVRVTGLPVATLTDAGQYLVSSGSSSQSYDYSLLKINGQWRIDTLPPSQLLLTQADFQRVYQPRDLYFLTQSARTLVPDPVFVPQQATNTELATGLVKALLQDREQGWLSGAALAGFPSSTWLIDNPVIINGSNAVVDLGEKHADGNRLQLQQMAAQLAWTLGSGPTTIQSIELEINGRPVQITGSQYQLPQNFRSWVPTQPPASSLYLISSHGAVQELSGIGQPGPGRAAAVPGAAGTAGTAGTPAFSSVAVSPDRPWVAGIAAGGGAVYIGGLSHGARMREWRPTSGSCTSVSWDGQGNLWIAAGGDVWMLPPGGTSAPLVTLEGVPPEDEVTQFRVAPDGVRAAMIVRGTFNNRPGSQVQIAAISHSGPSASVGQPVTIGSAIPDPEALSWYGTDDLIVLNGSSSGPQLYEVPLNGGQPTPIATPGGVPVSVTATNPVASTAEIALGMSDGQIMLSANLGVFEPVRTVGAAPAYPG